MTEKRSPIPCSSVLTLFLSAALCAGSLPVKASEVTDPVLSNAKVVFRWARPDNGGGLLAIDDQVNGSPLLDAKSPKPAWWRVKLKDGRAIANTDFPCKVRSQQGALTFTWTGDVRVTVNARLGSSDTLLQTRIRVDSIKKGVGLRDVVFPIIDGINPLAKDKADDRVLYAMRTGSLRPSPLTTGQPLKMRYNIEYYMQFTALLGAGRGLYLGDHDPTAAWKDFSLTPNTDAQTLSYAVSHPVLNFGAAEPVTRYESPGDIVLGTFRGDWYDAARIYRRWAVTAPWCAKGPMVRRKDYPKWFLNTDYWAVGHISDPESIGLEFAKRDLFNFPNTITHDYGYYAQPYQHDLDPDYFPPRVGSVNYERTLKDLRGRGARVLPYVMGWMWNAASEDYQRRGAKEKGAMLADDGKSLLWSELSPGEENIAMCPASKLWRDKLTEVSVEFVKRYRTGGVYFDYFTTHMNDCFNPTHGHALGGGDYWAGGVNGLFRQVREIVQKIDREAIFTSEDLAEFCIDVVDAGYQGSYYSDAPIWQVVYHDYTQVFGGMHWQEERPLLLGRQWLYGHMNQLSGGITYPGVQPGAMKWYHNLLRCTYEFARPYLGYGEMLRPPVMSGDLPLTTTAGPDGPFTSRAVEGTAWRAQDGSVGIFFFNYESQAHRVTWKVNLAEVAGFGAAKRLKITRWTVDKGRMPMTETKGNIVGETANISPLGLIALKLEVAR